MDLDFDKEMDNLLRRAARNGGFVSANALEHLDADEISAFAENALPEKIRAVYVRHFADCDRCRTILANLILFNAEVANETAASAVIAPIAGEIKLPWYQRIFALPKLPYVMSGLAVLFVGLLGVLILQNSMQKREAAVSQIEPEKIGGHGPNAETIESFSNSNAANANMMSYNSTANSATISNAMPSNAPTMPSNTTENAAKNRATDETPGTDGKEESPNETRAKEPAPTDSAAGTVLAKPETERKSDVEESEKNKAEDQSSVADSVTMQPAPRAAAPPPPAKSNRSNETELDAKKRTAQDKDQTGTGGTRQIAGKTFNRRGGIWYDAAYQDQKTINIRRGTDKYRKLDDGLRSIGDNLSGTVVVVWKGKAYRIQ